MTGPPALRLEPSLEIVLDPAASGHVGAELSYMTGGLSWSAEHSLVRTGEKTATWTLESDRLELERRQLPGAEAWTRGGEIRAAGECRRPCL
jgi:hypothetical protein